MLFTYSALDVRTEERVRGSWQRKAAVATAIACLLISGLVSTVPAGTPRAVPPVIVTAPTTAKFLGVPFTIPITVSDISGDGIFAFQFNIVYDPGVIDPSGPNFGCSTPPGTLAGNAGLTATCNVIPDGTLRVSVSGIAPMTGSGTLINLSFTTDVTAEAGDFSLLTFENIFFFNAGGPVLVGPPVNGRVNILGPTAAQTSISGRVTNDAGRALAGARVSLADESGQARFALTNPFGYFRFFDVPTGESYVVSVTSKKYVFEPRLVNVGEEVTGLDFVPIEP